MGIHGVFIIENGTPASRRKASSQIPTQSPQLSCIWNEKEMDNSNRIGVVFGTSVAEFEQITSSDIISRVGETKLPRRYQMRDRSGQCGRIDLSEPFI